MREPARGAIAQYSKALLLLVRGGVDWTDLATRQNDHHLRA
jgi:hypothetical protein